MRIFILSLMVAVSMCSCADSKIKQHGRQKETLFEFGTFEGKIADVPRNVQLMKVCSMTTSQGYEECFYITLDTGHFVWAFGPRDSKPGQRVVVTIEDDPYEWPHNTFKIIK